MGTARHNMPDPDRKGGCSCSRVTGLGSVAACSAFWLVSSVLPAVGGGHAATASLRPGEFYFRTQDRQTFLLGRNATGWQASQFAPLLQWAGESGERMVRIHLTTGIAPRGPAGDVDEEWARHWDGVFDMAAEHGLFVLPVFGVWADWNDGREGEQWHSWQRNPYNAALGGPAHTPDELLRDTPCRALWLQWLGRLVTRWQARSNILCWEICSELNLVTGCCEAEGVEFAERAAAVIRAADPRSRPITASLSGISEWPALLQSEALDLLQIHPYANHPLYRGNLGDMIIQSVRRLRGQYGKPVLIGESGLDSRGPRDTLTSAPTAHIGIKHALWASVVSGAMNGRMLWWEDGYDQYHGLDLRTRYKHASAPVARFVEGLDFAGFESVEVTADANLVGAAIGNQRMVLGWFREARCSAPDWPVRRLEGTSVLLRVPGPVPQWRVEFYDTGSAEIVATRTLRREAQGVSIRLVPFEDSIAFKMSPASASRKARE